MLQIQFNAIPEGGLHLSVDDDSWFPDQELSKCGEPKVEIHLKRDGDRVVVDGSIEVTLVFSCDRCLEEFVSPQEIDFQLMLEVSDPAGVLPSGQDAECEFDPGQNEVLFFDGQLVDLGDLLYQQMILAVPQKNLCRPDCRGICEHCGASCNSEQCGCASESGASPFASLDLLLKK